MTKHAQVRKKQRGFSDMSISLIQKFGRIENAPGGVITIIFDNREYQMLISELKQMIQLPDKAKGGRLVVANESIITVMK